MKSLRALAVVVLLNLIWTSQLYANDSFLIQDFWLKNDSKVVCASFNLSQVSSEYFFVFDYSPAIGTNLGRPWTVVEEEKCYQLEGGQTDLFAVKQTEKNERQIIINEAQKQESDAGFSDIFCEDYASEINKCESEYTIIPVNAIFWEETEEGLGSSTSEIYGIGLWSFNLFPTKYVYKALVTRAEASPSFGWSDINKDSLFKEVQSLYETLTTDLSSTLFACDTRQRAEYRISLNDEIGYDGRLYFYSDYELIWRLKDGDEINLTKVDAGKEYDIPDESSVSPLPRITAMGCADAYRTFVQENSTHFLRLDSIAEMFNTKYPDEVENFIDVRSQDRLDALQAFTTVTVEDDIEPDSETENMNSPTELEGPTMEKKMDILTDSEDRYTQAYFILPVFALVGILFLYYIFRRKKR